MQVIRGIPAQAEQASVLTIGNFDGVHLGHRALLRELTARAAARGLPAVVLTFEPHPREFFQPDAAPTRLASLREKLLWLSAAGVDRVHVCRFNQAFAALTAEKFINRVLLQGLAVRELIIGDDFRFGAKRQGDFAALVRAGQQHGFQAEAMNTYDLGGVRVSSSAVRAALAAGDLTGAARLLGRPYSIAGRVIHGEKIGRTLGFPTANLQLKHRRPALAGVFAVQVEGLSDHPVTGAASIGLRPTVNQGVRPTLEVHLLDWQRECYGMHLRLHFFAKLRDEMRYESRAALTAQIARDVEQTRRYFLQMSAVGAEESGFSR